MHDSLVEFGSRKGGFGYIAAMRDRRTKPILEAKGLALGLRLGLSSPWAL